MAKAGIPIVDREFQRAIIEYTAATGKGYPEVVNRVLKNLAFRAASFTPRAKRVDITQLVDRPWWIRFVAKRIREMGVNIGTAKKRKTAAGVGDSKRAEKLASASRKIISGRTKSTTFMRGGFLKGAQKLGEAKAKVKTALTKSKAVVRKATKGRLTGTIVVQYEANTRKPTDKRNKEKIGNRAILKAVRFVTKDMLNFVDRLLKTQSRRVSVR